MKKGPFKMKGMDFGASPVKQKGFIRTPDSFDHGKARAEAKKRVADQKARDNFNARQSSKSKAKDFVKNINIKKPTTGLNTLKNIAKGASRVLGGAGVAATMYDMYKSGQKKSGGKTFKNQKTGVVKPDPKKSIYNKPKKSIYNN